MEGDGDLVVIEVAGPVEEVGFDAAFRAFVDGGAAADVGDTGIWAPPGRVAVTA